MSNRALVLSGIVVAAVLLAVIAVGLGCASRDALIHTEYLLVDAGGHDVDIARLDAEWSDVARCYRRNPHSTGAVVIVEDAAGVINGAEVIPCDVSLSRNGLCWGWASPARKQVHLPPDLTAWRHEASEVWWYTINGEQGKHGAGCWL